MGSKDQRFWEALQIGHGKAFKIDETLYTTVMACITFYEFFPSSLLCCLFWGYLNWIRKKQIMEAVTKSKSSRGGGTIERNNIHILRGFLLK